MDELHTIALEEIALEGKRGCSVNLLWQLLEPRLPASIPTITAPLKHHLWQLLRSQASRLTFSTQELQEQAREAAKLAGHTKKKKKKKKGEEQDDELPQIITEIPLEAVPESVVEAEETGIVLVAPESARLSVVGVYDELEANFKLSEHQLAVLEMVGQRRHHGAVQTDMANELGVQHRNFFYVLKMLEARHMIVRNKLMVPMPASSNNSGWSTTSIVHLPRYAPRVVLGAEAVFKEVQTAQGQQLQQQSVQQQGQSSGSYVVRDDATVMQQICDFLGRQNGQYVSESQVKAVLGFTGSATAHRQWRRLRTRLIKIGCIAAELGMIGEKAISVLKLVKAYKLKLLVVVNSDEEQEEAAGGDEGDDADTPAGDKAAADDGDQEAEGEEAADATAAAGGSKLPVEVGREQLLLEIICEAGPEGILTPELSKRLGVSPRILLRSLPELCKKFGVRIEYDMPNKALTNRLIAPQHLLDKYNQQKHLLGMTPASVAAATAPATEFLQVPGSTAQQQQPAEAGASPADGTTHQKEEQVPATAAASGSQASAPADQDNLLQQQATTAGSKGKRGSGAVTADASQPAAAGKSAVDAKQGSHRLGQQRHQQAATSSPAAAGDDAESNSMDIDDPAAAALDAVLREAVGIPAEQAPVAAADEPEVDSAAAGAALAGAAQQPPPPPAGAGTAGGAATHGEQRPTAKRLAGLSTQPPIGYVSGSTAAAVAKGAMYKVREVTAVAAMSGSQPAQSAGQTASSAQLPDGHTAAALTDSVAAAGPADSGAPVVWGPGGVSRLQQRRLQILRKRLQDTGFLMKQELRRLIMNSEVQPATQQKPHNLYDGTGPDAKTCNRLIGLLTDAGAAKLVKLQYHQEAVLEPKEVEVLLRADIEQTPELLQRIAVYDAELPGNLRREGMRRALLAQGLVGRVAATAATKQGNGISKGAFADLGLRVASDQVQLLPVAANLRSLPGYGIRNTAAAAPEDEGVGRKRRSRGSGGRRGRRKGAAAAAAGEGSAAGDTAAMVDAAEVAADPAVVTEATPAAMEEGAQQLQQQPPVKGQEIAQLHHNGYMPSLMLRARLLHQYLCGCVNLKVEPHDDIPVSMAARGHASTTLSSTGYAANNRPRAARRLQFMLVDESPEQPQQQEGSQQDRGDEGPDGGGLFQLSRPARVVAETVIADAAGTNVADPAAEDDTRAAAAAEAATIGDQQQCEALEQQLGGRLLSVSQLWLHMPLAVALQVGGTSCRILNLLQLVCETSPPPTIASFDSSHRDTVFGEKAWRRVVTGLAVLTKLKLVTAARKGSATNEQSWAQCHPTRATHLVIGTLGVIDEPTQAADAVPARLDFDFTQTGKWREYWNEMQSLYDTPLFTLGQLQQFFPASCVPDVARHRCWVTYRDMPMAPFLRVQARLEGLPVEQLDVHTARQVSEELGLGFSQVHQLVTRLRTDINERREKAGLERIYLLNRTASADTAAQGTSKKKRASTTTGKAERDRRRRKHEKRRLKRLKGQQAADGSSVAGSATTGIPSGSESDAESEGQSDADSDEQVTAAAGAAAAAAAAAGMPPRPPKKASKAKRKSQSRRPQGSAAAAGSGSSLSGSESDVSSGDDKQQGLPASLMRRQLPKVVLQLTTDDAAGAADEDVCADSAAAAAARGSDSWDSDDDKKHPLLRISTAGADSGVVAADRDMTGTEDVPARIAGKRHRWTPAQDRQLLKWVVKQRVELGTRGQVRWQHATGLPLRVDLCTRRFNFLKKSNASSRFIASLEAQATEIHKEFSSRRSALQQQLSRLQREDRLSVNPNLLQQRQGASSAGSQHQQAVGSQVPALVPADYDPPLQPLPGGQQQQQDAGQSAPVAGGPGTAASWMAAAGPHKINPEGNIVLLPDSTVLVKYGKPLEQIEDFVTPRQQLEAFNRGRRPASAAARASGDGGPVGLRQQQQRRRRVGRGSDVEQGDFDEGVIGESDAGISSGESEGEDDWALLTNHAGAAGTAAAPQRRSSTPGQKRRHGHGSRQVRPLRTVADRVAHSTALLAAASAAAAAVIAQRRAAGEQIDLDAEQRERQLQLQAYIEGNRKRHSKQRKPNQGSAIANPRDLIQSWRRHHAGVETRPALAKTQPPAAAAGVDRADGSNEQSMVAATATDNLEAVAASRESTPVAPAADVHRPTGTTAEGAAAAGEVAARGGGGGAAATVAAWPYGPAPTVPVVCAMHLITSLLHLVAEAGSLPVDASLALLLRFSQAEVAAAFRWLRALGWLNSGAARRPFQLSTTWNKRLRGEGVIADLLGRAAAAQLALRQLGLLGLAGSSTGVGLGASAVTELVTEHGAQDAPTDGTQEPPHAAAAGTAEDARVAQQLLAGLRQVELDKAGALQLKELQKEKPSQQQQAMIVAAKQQQEQAAVDQQQAAEQQDKQQQQHPGSGHKAADGDQHTTKDLPDTSAAAKASAGTQPAAAAGVQQQQEEEEQAAEDDTEPLHTPKAITNCLAVLHPVSDIHSSRDSTQHGSFWVGLQPPTAGTTARPQPQPVPGGLLLELIISSAMGRLCVQLCPVAYGLVRSRGVARGEAAGLGQKAPQLLVQLSAGHADMRPTTAAAAADSDCVEGGALAAAGDGGATAAPQLIAGNSSSQGSAGSLSFMCYCGVGHAEGLVMEQPGTPVKVTELATATSRKRQSDELEAASILDELHFPAFVVGKEAATRQQAEAACLAAATAGQPDAEKTAHEHDNTGRPSKRLKTAGPTQDVGQASAMPDKCQPQLVRVLLAAVRDAGSLGVSHNKLLHLLQRAGPARGATGCGNAADNHDQDAPDTAAAPGAASTAEQAQVYPLLDSAADTLAAAAAAEAINAFSALPGELLGMPNAAAVAAVFCGLRLLQQYGLIRHVPGWQDSVWLSAEDSQRLLAWPLPQQHSQQQQQSSQQPQADKQQQGQQQEPKNLLQQQQQEGGGTGHLLPLSDQARPAAETDNDATIAIVGSAAEARQPAAAADKHGSFEQHDNGSSSSREVLVAPWLDHKGRLNHQLWQSLVKRIMSMVLRNPGIPESLLVGQLDIISPAAAKEALGILVQDKHLICKAVAIPAQPAGAPQLGVAAAGQNIAATGILASEGAAAANKISTCAGSHGHGGWGGGAVALRLGAGLTNCTPTPAKPPSLLIRKKPVCSSSPEKHGAEDEQPGKAQLLDVQHYWPSLTSSTSCHLTCTPPGCRLS